MNMLSKQALTLGLLALAGSAQAQATADYPIQAVPFTQVKLADDFWLPRLKTNTDVTIPASFQRCEATNRVKNFEMAAAHQGKFATTYPFDDTDIYKTIEGASYSLSLYPDEHLKEYVDALIKKVAAAQEPDGYLYTARTIDPAHPHSWAGKERWEKERELSHELYNAGHLYEAAVAHYQATGQRNLLNIALKNADLVCSVFGPGRRAVAPGHEIVEMGLVKLYRVTGQAKYLATAKFFLDQRGHYPGYDPKSPDEWKNGQYWQDDKPVIAQTEAEGHAVRAEYLYSAMADVAALTGDKQLLAAVDTIWNNMVTKKMYVQGGTGAVGGGERFGANYELPNATAYNETCASVADVYWQQRMFQLHGDAKYADIMEKVLYNGLISGVGLDGKSFFYTNAMQIKGGLGTKDTEPARSGWFDCSCCPTNLARLFPSLPGYVYGQHDKDVYVNLFVSGTADLKVNKKPVQLTQQNNYPWDGALKFVVNPAAATDFNLLVRVPGWARGEAMPSNLYTFATPAKEQVVIKINGRPTPYVLRQGYAVLGRKWHRGDVVEMALPMDVRRVVANSHVQDDLGKVALQRGPLMYCAEWPDNKGKASNFIVPPTAAFTASFRPDLLNGVTTLTATVPAVQVDEAASTIQTVPQTLTAIPYYAWANRGKGEMTVWFPAKVVDVDLVTRPPGEPRQIPLSYMRFLPTLTTALALAAPLLTAAQTVQLTVQPGDPKLLISKHIQGQFAEHLGRCIYGGFWVEPGLNVPKQGRIRMDIVEALRKIHVPNLRWPGGCFADTYHWHDGVGPAAQRPKMLNLWWGNTLEDNSFGTHEFLELCGLLGTEPYLAANVGSGTVQEMSNWMEYLNSDEDTPMVQERKKNGHAAPYKVSWWGIGNESWGCGGNMTADYYTSVYKRYATFAHDYPGTQLKRIVSGANGDDANWTETCMKNIPLNQLWGLTLHQYTLPTGSWSGSKGKATGFGEDQYFSTLRNALKMDAIVTKHAAIMDKYDKDKKVALLVDEWGVWTDVEPGTNPGFLYQQNTLRDALVAGTTLNIFNNHCDRVRGANLAQAINVLQALVLTDKEKMLLTPTYHVFDLYQVHQDAEYLPMQFSSPDYVFGNEKIPALNASASKDKNGAVHISLVNLDPKKALTLETALPGVSFKTVTGRVLTSANVSDHNTFDKPNTVQLAAFAGAKKRGDKLAVTLPAKSVVVLELK